MSDVKILWVDFRVEQRKAPFLFGTLSLKFISHYVKYSDSLFSEINSIEPTILIFLYDAPTSNGLSQLEKTKKTYPSIPILMITKSHSEALAIWALRAKVWDYFVEPVPANDFTEAVMIVADLKSNNGHAHKGNIRRLKAPPPFIQTKVVSKAANI